MPTCAGLAQVCAVVTGSMRLWSLHPRYLDAVGLVACWREGLLARAVLAGTTVGYRRHPQLDRFRGCADPVGAIDAYLQQVYAEARRRGYRFDASKIGPGEPALHLPVTNGQLACERAHLLEKLSRRGSVCRQTLADASTVDPHPLFFVVPGPAEPWERLSNRAR